LIGTRLAARYEVLSELGRGGMGVVYRARDPVLSRDVAVKLIPPGNLTPDSEERFLREAQIVAQMDHPAIVPIYDLGRHEGALFFVMPVLSGTNLRHLLRDGTLRLGDVLDIGSQVAEALDYSHSRGVVHRDVKPENIMTSREEGGQVRARVMDFGLALASSENRLTKTGTLVGTVSYFAPEQVSSHSFDGRTDIYSLGTVLYECLSGEPPFGGEVQSALYRIVHEVPRPLRGFGTDVTEELETIVLQCLEKDRERRPKRAAHLAEALRRYRGKLREDEYTRSVVLTASRMLERPAAAAAPFIGREKELTALQKRLHAAVAGECQLALVAGEPGTGKTRLLEELVTLAKARKIRVLSGRFVEQDRAFAHQGFCELVQDFFRSRDTLSEAVSRPDFSDLAGELVALFPVLSENGELRSAAESGARPAPGGDARKGDDRTAVFELLARTLTRIGQGKPLLLALENLHGAELSIEALQYVVRRLGSTPTLVVGTYRQTEVGPKHPLLALLDAFADDPRFLSLTLGPLSASESRALVESAVGGAKLASGLVERIYDATEGNPFFTKELVKSLVDSGGIARDESGVMNFSRGAAISSDALPATIQQAIERRIKRLPEELREVLSIASVLGRSFEFRDLESVAPEAGDLDSAVERLVAEGILEEERESRGDRLAFTSGMVRDVLYGAYSRRKRRALHRKYADLLEKRHAGRLERVYPELVHHFTQGDVPEKTVAYGLKLAEKALEASSADEAIRVARSTLEVLEDEGWTGDRVLEGEARFLLARAHRMAGSVDAALDESEAAVKVFAESKDQARAVEAIVFAAETAWQGRRAEETRRWVERGAEAARGLGNLDALRKLLALAATVANLRGEYQRAAAFLAEIAALARASTAAAVELPRGGRLAVAMSSPITAMEPAATQIDEETEVLGNVFETLVTTDERGNPVPSLCEEWSLLDGGRTVRLRLRGGVRFSDGTPLTAEAVKASFTHAATLRRDELPAAFATVRGVEAFVSGGSDAIEGFEVRGDDGLDIHLLEPLPIFPALLTDRTAAIGLPRGGRMLGTGPFQLAERTSDRVVLERNPLWRGAAPPLDAVEFRAPMNPAAIAAGLRSGELDLGRDLHPEDLDALLREPRFRTGLVETPKRNTYFATFNVSRPAGGNEGLRQALSGVVRTQDLVWGALGRFALPATGLLPPGILGHDAGRRRPHLTREKAAALVAASGLPQPVRLAVALHPFFLDRYRALTTSLLELWKEIGVEASLETPTMAEYLASYQKPQGFDVRIGRWNADYDDPDNFTFSLFHGTSGLFKGYFSSKETDALLEEARRESRSVVREGLYRKFENVLLDAGILIPLFHDVDYRIAAPRVRGLALRSGAPYVNYGELAKQEAAAPAASLAWGGGVLRLPISGSVYSLEPATADAIEQGEVIPSIFETLTRDEGAGVVPWLASELSTEQGGTRFRFRLRPGVRFHDGRPLTARDVRYSFERLLQTGGNEVRWILSSIRGAKKLIAGEAADLAGFHIVSPSELVIELEEPLSFFPVLVSTPAAAILPEGTGTFGNSWRSGCVGTGPFRVVEFEPGRRLELERSPGYWREGYPRSEGLSFRFGVPPAEIKSEFLAGRFSLAGDLLPADAEALRHDPRFASGYRESPRLLTYLMAFNSRAGAFRDAGLRRGLANALDRPALVRKTLGRSALPATGLIPPGLLGHSAEAGARPAAGRAPDETVSKETVEVSAVVHPIFFKEYASYLQELTGVLREMGVGLRIVNRTQAEMLEGLRSGSADLYLGRWDADYPDADSFVRGLIHTREGILGAFCGSPEVDRLAEAGRAESDPRIRHSIYRQVEEILAREALLVPLFHEQVYRFAQPGVEGLTVGYSAPAVRYEDLRMRG